MKKYLNDNENIIFLSLGYIPAADLLEAFTDVEEIDLVGFKEDDFSFLKSFKKLKSLAFFESHKLTAFPKVLIEIKTLRQLEVQAVAWHQESWNGLEQMYQLESLTLRFLNYAIPSQLFQLKQLEELSLDHLNGWKYEVDLSRLKGFNSLKKINLIGMVNYESVLATLPSLEELICSVKLFNYEPEKLMDFDHLKTLKLEGSRKEDLRKAAKFLKHTRRQHSFSQIKPVFKAVFKKEKNIEDLNNQELLCLLNSGVDDYIYAALDEIDVRINNGIFFKSASLENGLKIKICGKTGISLKKMVEQLEVFDIEVFNHRSKKEVDFILLGKDPGLTLNKELPFLTEKCLQDWLDKVQPRYLLDANSCVDLQHIHSLLMSHDESQIELAWQLMEGGGMPAGFVTASFLIYKSDLAKDIKARAKNYLELHASPLLRQKYIRKRELISPDLLEDRRLINLKFYLEGTELDALEVILYLEKNYLYTQFIDFALTYLERKEQIKYLQHLFCFEEISLMDINVKFPDFEEELTSRVRRLMIALGVKTELPAIIRKLNSLEELEIYSFNPLILPNDFFSVFPVLRVLKIRKDSQNVPLQGEFDKAGCTLEYFG